MVCLPHRRNSDHGSWVLTLSHLCVDHCLHRVKADILCLAGYIASEISKTVDELKHKILFKMYLFVYCLNFLKLALLGQWVIQWEGELATKAKNPRFITRIHMVEMQN